MIAAAVNSRFGIIASDSSFFDTKQNKILFETMKLFFTGQYLITYMGNLSYFSKLDKSKFSADLPSLCIYMEDYLKKMKPEVEKSLKSEISAGGSSDICLLILGVANRLPTIVQFNSEFNFKPKYLFSSDKTKFSTIAASGKDKKLFTEVTEYMERKFHKLTKSFQKPGNSNSNVNTYLDPITPGLLGEILTRGIYKKIDLDIEKRSGGVVNLAGMWSNGLIFQLSGLTPA